MSDVNKGEILIYQSEEGQTKIDVLLEDESLWLTQQQLADLFQTSKQNISLHTANIFKEGELSEEATVKEYLTVRQEGNREVRRQLAYYNLDVIISIGYRVKSHIATNFRIWATERLREYLIVSQYLDFAELQARRRKPMHMKDWMEKLHGFLTLNEQEILTHKGLVSKNAAKAHAETEYDKYRQELAAAPDELDKAIKRLNQSPEE